MADQTQNRAMPPLPLNATLRIGPAENGGYVILIEGEPSMREKLYAAFSNAEDLLDGLAMIYAPLPTASEASHD